MTMRVQLFHPGTICLVALLLACTASFAVTPPTVTSTYAKVNTPQSGNYQPNQTITGTTTHRAVFDTTNGEYQPFKLVIIWESYPSWAPCGAGTDDNLLYTYNQQSGITVYSSPNPVIYQWTTPGPGQYSYVANTIAIPYAASRTYGPPPPPPPPPDGRDYTQGDPVQGDPDVTQITVVP